MTTETENTNRALEEVEKMIKEVQEVGRNRTYQQMLEEQEMFETAIQDYQKLSNERIIKYLIELKKGVKTPHDTEYDKEVATNLLSQILTKGGVAKPISDFSVKELEQELTKILSGLISASTESEEDN